MPSGTRTPPKAVMNALVEGEARLSAVEHTVRVAKCRRPADPRPDEIDSADERVVASDEAAHEAALEMLEQRRKRSVIGQRRQESEARASCNAGSPDVAGDLVMPGRGQRRRRELRAPASLSASQPRLLAPHTIRPQ